MKKKGFTLVELLAVIVILGVIATISIFSVSGIFSSSKEGIAKDKIMNIESAAVNYVQTKNISLDESCTVNGTKYNFCKKFTVKFLLQENFLESHDEGGKVINDTTGESMENDVIAVYRKAGKLYATVTCLKSKGDTCS